MAQPGQLLEQSTQSETSLALTLISYLLQEQSPLILMFSHYAGGILLPHFLHLTLRQTAAHS